MMEWPWKLRILSHKFYVHMRLGKQGSIPRLAKTLAWAWQFRWCDVCSLAPIMNWIASHCQWANVIKILNNRWWSDLGDWEYYLINLMSIWGEASKAQFHDLPNIAVSLAICISELVTSNMTKAFTTNSYVFSVVRFVIRPQQPGPIVNMICLIIS